MTGETKADTITIKHAATIARQIVIITIRLGGHRMPISRAALKRTSWWQEVTEEWRFATREDDSEEYFAIEEGPIYDTAIWSYNARDRTLYVY